MSTTEKTHAWIFTLGTILSGAAAIGFFLSNLNLLGVLVAGVFLGLIGPALYYIPKLSGIYSVLRAIHTVVGGVRTQATSEAFRVQTQLPKVRKVYTVYHLDKPPKHPEKYSLNWITFLSGCEALADWVHDRVKPHLYVGINPCGVMVASYIRCKLGDDRIPFATYLTSTAKPGEPGQLQGLPTAERFDGGPILLVDSRIKSGDTISEAAKAIRGQLGNDVELWCVCLLACGITRKSVDEARRASRTATGDPILIEWLFKKEINTCVQKESLDFYPHGIAYVAEGIVELPSGLR